MSLAFYWSLSVRKWGSIQANQLRIPPSKASDTSMPSPSLYREPLAYLLAKRRQMIKSIIADDAFQGFWICERLSNGVFFQKI
jgi:hypothetical protein